MRTDTALSDLLSGQNNVCPLTKCDNIVLQSTARKNINKGADRMRCRREVKSGAVLELEIYSVADGTRNIRTAKPKPAYALTEEQKEEKNRKASEKRLVRAVNSSFSSAGWYIEDRTTDRRNCHCG